MFCGFLIFIKAFRKGKMRTKDILKFFNLFPLGIKGFVFQVFYGLFLFAVVKLFNLSLGSMLFGFVFAHVYIGLFFYSIFLIFKTKHKKQGVMLMFVKWLLLLFVLIAISLFLDGYSFLLGLSALLSFLLCYVLENSKKILAK